MKIREISVDDAEPLALLLKEVGWFELFNNQSLAVVTELVKSQLERSLADDSHAIFVAESLDGEVLGYVSAHWLPYLFLPGPEGFVSELFVRPTARGQGLGRQLLEIVQKEAHARAGARVCRLSTFVSASPTSADFTPRWDGKNAAMPPISLTQFVDVLLVVQLPRQEL